jgi:hypothetical protein
MTVLKLCAIDLDYCTGILQQGLGGCLNDASLSGACRPQEKKVCDRPPNRRQSRHVSLVSPHDLVNCFVLPYDKVVKSVLQILRLLSRFSGI